MFIASEYYSDIGSAESACIGSLLAVIPASNLRLLRSNFIWTWRIFEHISFTAPYKENAKK